MVTVTTSTVISTTPPIVATAVSPLPATATNTPVQAKVKTNLYTVDVVNVSSDSQTDGYQNMDNDVSDRCKRLTKKRPRYYVSSDSDTEKGQKSSGSKSNKKTSQKNGPGKKGSKLLQGKRRKRSPSTSDEGPSFDTIQTVAQIEPYHESTQRDDPSQSADNSDTAQTANTSTPGENADETNSKRIGTELPSITSDHNKSTHREKINIQSKILDITFSNDSNTNKQSKVSDAKINMKSKPTDTKTNKQSKVSDTKTAKPKVSTKTASNNNKTNNKSKLPGKQSNKSKKTNKTDLSNPVVLLQDCRQNQSTSTITRPTETPPHTITSSQFHPPPQLQYTSCDPSSAFNQPMAFSQPSIDAIRHVVDEAMTSFFHQFYTTPEANPDRFQTPGRFSSFNLASNIFPQTPQRHNRPIQNRNVTSTITFNRNTTATVSSNTYQNTPNNARPQSVMHRMPHYYQNNPSYSRDNTSGENRPTTGGRPDKGKDQDRKGQK